MPKNSNRLPGEGLAQPTLPATNPRERRMLLALLHRNLSREALDRAVRQSGLAGLDVLVPLASASLTAGVGAVVLRLLGVI